MSQHSCLRFINNATEFRNTILGAILCCSSSWDAVLQICQRYACCKKYHAESQNVVARPSQVLHSHRLTSFVCSILPTDAGRLYHLSDVPQETIGRVLLQNLCSLLLQVAAQLLHLQTDTRSQVSSHLTFKV